MSSKSYSLSTLQPTARFQDLEYCFHWGYHHVTGLVHPWRWWVVAPPVYLTYSSSVQDLFALINSATALQFPFLVRNLHGPFSLVDLFWPYHATLFFPFSFHFRYDEESPQNLSVLSEWSRVLPWLTQTSYRIDFAPSWSSFFSVLKFLASVTFIFSYSRNLCYRSFRKNRVCSHPCKASSSIDSLRNSSFRSPRNVLECRGRSSCK